MGPLLLFTIILSVYGGFAIDVQCPEEGCGNLTIYLGPRWGSKVIILSQHEGNLEPVREPSTGYVRRLPPSTTTPQPRSHTTETATSAKLPAIYRWRERFMNPTPMWYKRYRTTTGPTSRTPMWYKRYRTTTGPTSRPALTQRGLGDWSILNLTDTRITGNELKDLLSGLTENDRSHLQYLYLSHNNITELQLFTFPVESELHVQELRLDNNPLQQLTDDTIFEISRLHRLKTLNLSRCELLYIECPQNPSLRVLDLSHNRLASLPFYLERLPMLSSLLLANNRIKHINPFSPNYILNSLSLSNNFISYVNSSTFQSLRNLFELRLDNNLLDDYSLVSVRTFTVLYLSGNPWECSCSLLDKALLGSIHDSYNLTCHYPGFSSQLLVSNVDRDDVRVGCRVRNVKERLQDLSEDAARWFRHRVVHMTDILQVLSWALLVGMVVLAARLLVRRRADSAKSGKDVPAGDVPYTNLDEKMLA